MPEPKGTRLCALRKQEYGPGRGELLAGGHDDRGATAVVSAGAELHRAGIGHLLGFQSPAPARGRYMRRAVSTLREK
ncbi:hypothetical protein [Streptomyces sp. NPDC003480]